MSSLDFSLGVMSDETVMLDFDDTTLDFVLYWARVAMDLFELGGFLIRKSSEGCFHTVFDRIVTWKECLRVVAMVVLNSHHEGLKKWFILQARKGSMTLRCTPKGLKPCPVVVHREGSQDDRIQRFLEREELITLIMCELSEPEDLVDY